MECPVCTSRKLAVDEQPAPVAVEGIPAMWDLVIQDVGAVAMPGSLPALVVEDMKIRDRVKSAEYKQRLQAFNGRNCLIDLYQELLDSSVYAKQGVYEELDPDMSEIYREVIKLVKRTRTILFAKNGR